MTEVVQATIQFPYKRSLGPVVGAFMTALTDRRIIGIRSGDRVIAMFGIALASAVALDAFVLRTLLVPALMHLLGGANWWLPRRLDRVLPRISIEPPECRAAHERLAAATDAEVADVLAKEREQQDVRDIPG